MGKGKPVSPGTSKPTQAVVPTTDSGNSIESVLSQRKKWVIVGMLAVPVLLLSVWAAIHINPRLFVNKPTQLQLNECQTESSQGVWYNCRIKSEKRTQLRYGLVVPFETVEAVTFGLAIRRTSLLMEQNQLRVQIKGSATIHHSLNKTTTTVTFDNFMENRFATFKPRMKDSHVFRYLTVHGLQPQDRVSVHVSSVRVFKTVLGWLGREFLQSGDVGVTFLAESDPYKLVYSRIMVVKAILTTFMIFIILKQFKEIATSFKKKAAYKWKDLLVTALLFLMLVDLLPDCVVRWGNPVSQAGLSSIQSHFSSLRTMLIHHISSSLLTWAYNFYSLNHFIGHYKCCQYLMAFLAVGSLLGLYSRLGVLVDTYNVIEPLHGLNQLGYRSVIVWKISSIMHAASVGLGLVLPFCSVLVAQLKPQDSPAKSGSSFYTIAFGCTFLVFQAMILGKSYYIGDWNLWRVMTEHSILLIALAVFSWVPALEKFGSLDLSGYQVCKGFTTIMRSTGEPEEENQPISSK